MADRVVSYDFRASIGDLTGKMAAAGRSVQDLGTKLTALDASGARMRRGLDTIGGSAGRLGLVAAAGLAATAKAAIDWESAWAGVNKTVDGSTAQMAELEAGLRNLAKTMPATHEEIAATAEAAGQLGVAREDIVDFTKTMLMLGETTNLSADEAATAIAQMANVMGTSGADVDNLGAALVALGNDGASTEAQILGMAQRIAGAGAQIGLAESDILAIANAAASMGIEVEAGGTAISRVFTDMAKATAQGGEDLDKFAEIAGVSAAEFARVFSETPAEAFALFTSGLDRIKESGGDVFTALENIGLSDIRVSQALLGMAASGDLLTDSLRTGADAWSENTALTDEYGKRVETTGAQVRIAWNNIKDAAIQVGDVLLPVVADAAGGIADLASAFGDLPGPVKSSVTALGGLTAIFGGGLWFTSKVVGGIANTKQALSDLGIVAGNSGRSLGTFVGAAAKIGGTVIAIKLLNDALDDVFNTRIDESTLPRDLEALARGELTDNLGHLEADLRQLTSTFEDAKEPLGEFVHGFGLLGDTPMDKANENINKIDESLASMVDSGNGEKAAVIFEEILRIAKEGGLSASEAAGEFDRYSLALRNADAATPDPEQGQRLEQFFKTGAEGARDLADGAEDAEEKIQGLNGALKELAGWLDKREALRGFEDSMKALSKSLDEGKVGQWAENVDAVGNSLIQVAENLKGPARRTFIDDTIAGLQKMTEDAGPKAKAEVGKLIRELQKLDNTDAEPKIGAKDEEFQGKQKKARADLASLDQYDVHPMIGLVDRASAGIQRIKNLMDGLHDKSITITEYRALVHLPTQQAQGGYIAGPGTATSDSIPAMLSNGEFVMKAAAVQRYGIDAMYAMNEMRLAAGGLVNMTHAKGYAQGGGVAGSSGPVGGVPAYLPINDMVNEVDRFRRATSGVVNIFAKFLREELKAAEKRRDALKEDLDAIRDHRNALRDAARSLSDSIASQFSGSDLFGAEGASFESILSDLKTEAGNASQFASLALRLKALGLDGGALQALLETGNLSLLQDFAAQGSGQLAAFEAQFNQTQQFAQQAGSNAVTVVLGEQLAQARADEAKAEERYKSQLKETKTIQKKLDAQIAATKQVGPDVARANNRTAAAAQRRPK